MKRIFSLSLAVLFVVALAIPVLATDSIPSLPDIEDASTYKYTTITLQDDNYYYLYFMQFEPYIDDANGRVRNSSQATSYKYKLDGGTWALQYKDVIYKDSILGKYVTSNYEPKYKDGSIYEPPAPVECDGSTCPATDQDHDNICDDCGRVLTMSLRSSILEYAQGRAETYVDYPYYAVVQHATHDGSVIVYIAKEPMYALSPRYDTVDGDSLSWFQVNTNEDGTFAHTVRNSSEPWTGNLIYANHSIANFLEPPLAVVIQGVTGEAMETTLPNLYQTIRTIVLCGVGCLAFLMVFHLLRSRLFPYLKG